MAYTKFLPVLKQVSLFQDFTEDQLHQLIIGVKERVLKKDEYLFKEGDVGRDFFLIREGEVEVLKLSPCSSENILIATLGPGEIVGEISFIQGTPRDASIRAKKGTHILEISVHPKLEGVAFKELKVRMSELLAERMKRGNQVLLQHTCTALEHSKGRVILGNLIVHLLVLIFLYIFSVRLIANLNINIVSTSEISIPVLSFFAISVFSLIKNSGYPLRMYGFRWEKIGRVVIEAIFLSLPLLVVTTMAKWFAITFIPKFYDLSLFHFLPRLGEDASPGVYFIFLFLYVLFVPIQEIIFRGAIQSSLAHFLVGKHRTLQSILISNLPYSLIHLHLSVSFSFFVYIVGLYWGWMYARQQTLVGCIISHYIVGIWTFFILGAEEFLIV